MKFKKFIMLVIILGALLIMPSAVIFAKDLSFSTEVPAYDDYVYTFNITQPHDITFNIVDEGDSVVTSYVKSSDSVKHQLNFGSDNSATVSLLAGKYKLYIINNDDTDKYYDISILTNADVDYSDSEYSDDKYANTGVSIDEYDKTELEEVNEITFDLSHVNVNEIFYNGDTINNISIAAGDSINLEVDYVNGGAPDAFDIDYTFSNESCVELTDIESGKFTCLTAGDCIITATYNGSTDVINVHVYDVKYAISAKKYTIRYGMVKEVGFVREDGGYANDVLKASSSNNAVAVYDLDSNIIIAKGAGTCTLTFTMRNNQQVSCKVVVPTLTLSEELESKDAYTINIGRPYNVVENNITSTYINTFIGNRNETKVIEYVEYSIFLYNGKGLCINPSEYTSAYDGEIGTDGAIINNVVDRSAKKFRSCISKVYYTDGTTWTSPLYEKWFNTYNMKY